MTTNWSAWRDATIPAGSSVRAVAAATGADNKSAGRWLDSPRADWVIALARAYDADPIAGLVAAGFLTDADVRHTDVAAALRTATDLELAEEIYRRAAAGEAGQALTGGDVVPFTRTAAHVSDPYETLADAADDAADWEREDEEREHE